MRRRLKERNDGVGCAYIRSRRPVKLVYEELSPDRSRAQAREGCIKKFTRVRKETLIAECVRCHYNIRERKKRRSRI